MTVYVTLEIEATTGVSLAKAEEAFGGATPLGPCRAIGVTLATQPSSE